MDSQTTGRRQIHKHQTLLNRVKITEDPKAVSKARYIMAHVCVIYSVGILLKIYTALSLHVYVGHNQCSL